MLSAIEFSTRINDGVIRIPDIYRNQLQDNARIIVIMDNSPKKIKRVSETARGLNIDAIKKSQRILSSIKGSLTDDIELEREERC